MGIEIPDIDTSRITDKVLATQINQLLNLTELLVVNITRLQKENEELRAEIRTLKGLPKKPIFGKGSNSGTRQHGVSKDVEGEKKEWKKGSKGDIPIDTHIQLPEQTTCRCGNTSFEVLRTTLKIIQSIIFKRNNIGYHGTDKRCTACGQIYHSTIPPEHAGKQFDDNLTSFISYLRSCRTTTPLLHRMLRGLGIQISYGSLSNIFKENGKKLKKAYNHLRAVGYGKSEYLQSDATGAKRRDKHTGKIIHQHTQIVCTKLLSVFFITRYYNIATVQKILGKKGRDKPYVSDDGSPNGNSSMIQRIRQLCWVHELRHYQKLFPFFHEYRAEQNLVMGQWKAWYRTAKEYKKEPTEEVKRYLDWEFDRITRQETRYEALNKQLKLTAKKKAFLLTFLDYPYLPLHNNQCEQDLREFVIIRKISRETKSIAGDRSLARHLSIVQTAQKQGLNVLETLHGLLTSTVSPSILTNAIA